VVIALNRFAQLPAKIVLAIIFKKTESDRALFSSFQSINTSSHYRYELGPGEPGKMGHLRSSFLPCVLRDWSWTFLGVHEDGFSLLLRRLVVEA
jgi:hypothetical protein